MRSIGVKRYDIKRSNSANSRGQANRTSSKVGAHPGVFVAIGSPSASRTMHT